jgi:hypothetical protein
VFVCVSVYVTERWGGEGEGWRSGRGERERRESARGGGEREGGREREREIERESERMDKCHYWDWIYGGGKQGGEMRGEREGGSKGWKEGRREGGMKEWRKGTKDGGREREGEGRDRDRVCEVLRYAIQFESQFPSLSRQSYSTILL